MPKFTSFIRKVALSLFAGVISVSAMALDFNQVQKAANQGDAAAQYNLGYMYSKGEGVRQDDAKAVEWYQKAANQGDANAQTNLGVMYINGEGVQQDDAKAVEWFTKAANQGFSSAQTNLGLMYSSGQGVKKNLITAKEWFRKSCDNGDQNGCEKYQITHLLEYATLLTDK